MRELKIEEKGEPEKFPKKKRHVRCSGEDEASNKGKTGITRCFSRRTGVGTEGPHEFFLLGRETLSDWGGKMYQNTLCLSGQRVSAKKGPAAKGRGILGNLPLGEGREIIDRN